MARMAKGGGRTAFEARASRMGDLHLHTLRYRGRTQQEGRRYTRRVSLTEWVAGRRHILISVRPRLCLELREPPWPNSGQRLSGEPAGSARSGHWSSRRLPL